MEDRIEKLMELTGLSRPESRKDGFWFTYTGNDRKKLSDAMRSLEFRLSTATCLERGDGEFDVIYHFVHRSISVNIRITTKNQRMPSLAVFTPSANWIEREMRDLYAVSFDGHPDPRPLVRPPQMPEGFFRKKVAESLLKESEAK
jgi:NADH-quinone oxidoreductase subunit C